MRRIWTHYWLRSCCNCSMWDLLRFYIVVRPVKSWSLKIERSCVKWTWVNKDEYEPPLPIKRRSSIKAALKWWNDNFLYTYRIIISNALFLVRKHWLLSGCMQSCTYTLNGICQGSRSRMAKNTRVKMILDYVLKLVNLGSVVVIVGMACVIIWREWESSI